MKKSLRWLSVLLAVVMLMSAAMTTVMATDSEEEEFSSTEEYIMENLESAYRLSDGTWFIPGLWYNLTDEEYQELYLRYILGALYPTVKPSPYPGCTWPGVGFNPIITLEVEVDQYSTKALGLGNTYSYYSADSSIAYVNSYGYIVGVNAGTTTIVVTGGDYTRFLVNVTVNEVALEDSNVTIDLRVGDTTLYVGQSTTVRACLVRYPNYPIFSAAPEITITSGEGVIGLDGNTLTGLSVGRATITATYGELEQTMDIVVTEKATIVPGIPSFPHYPSSPNYPWYDFDYGWLYPWFDTSYPLWNFIAPEFSENSAINWEAILGIDTDTYEVEKKYSFINGTWMKTFTLIPKDGSDVTEYETSVRRVYVTGEWTMVAIKTPVDYVETPKAPEVDSTLTKEELEALKQAEEAAKKEAALKEKIAKALEGKLEWYEVYSDLWGDSYYTDAVAYCLKKQYVTGNDDYQTFGTSEKITWADLEEVLCVYLGVTEEELAALKFFSYEDSDEAITREEIALVIYNVAKHLKMDVSGKAALGSYKDYADLDAEYADAFAWAVKAKVLNKSSEKIDPNGSVDKARLCQILYKLDSIKK